VRAGKADTTVCDGAVPPQIPCHTLTTINITRNTPPHECHLGTPSLSSTPSQTHFIVSPPLPPSRSYSDVLPLPDWEEKLDPATLKRYYVHHATKTSTWTRPAPLTNPDQTFTHRNRTSLSDNSSCGGVENQENQEEIKLPQGKEDTHNQTNTQYKH